MTVSLNEVAYDFMEIYRQTYKDNDEVDIRQIKYWINYERASLIQKMFEKNPYAVPDERLVQELTPNGTGIETEIVDASDSYGLPSGIYVCRTNIAIPSTIDRFNSNGFFTKVGPANKLTQRYPVVSMETALVSGNGKFNSRQIYAYLDGNRVYFLSKNEDLYKTLTYVSVKGVFQNPKEVALLNSSTYTDDDDYPISLSMIEDIKKMLFVKEIKYSMVQPQDSPEVAEDITAKQTPAES